MGFLWWYRKVIIYLPVNNKKDIYLPVNNKSNKKDKFCKSIRTIFQADHNFTIFIHFKEPSEKELSLCHKLKFSHSYIFETWCFKLHVSYLYFSRSNRIRSLKYLRSTTSLGCEDKVVKKSEFVENTHFLSKIILAHVGC